MLSKVLDSKLKSWEFKSYTRHGRFEKGIHFCLPRFASFFWLRVM